MSTQGAVLTWGDFQPIIHLSIALNAAYATLYSFVDDMIKREAAIAKGVRDRAPALQKSKSRALLSKINEYERDIEIANRYWLKPICIVFSLIGVILLIISAYAGAHAPISTALSVLVVILLGPFFLAMIVYAAFFVLLAVIAAKNRRLLADRE